MSNIILRTHNGTEVNLTEEQALAIADKAEMIVVTDAITGKKTYLSKGSIATIGEENERQPL